jgi:hypothetical protein
VLGAARSRTESPSMGVEHKDDLVACVLGWHRRHPLARRLRPEQVQSIGWVVLPFVAADVAADAVSKVAAGAAAKAAAEVAADAAAGPPGDAGERAAAASAGRAGRWQPAFRETMVDGYPARRLVRWARRHGLPARPADDGLPLREATCDRARAPAGAPIERLWLRTALIDVDGARRRLLLAADGPAVLGRRLWSPARLALAIGVPIVASAVLSAVTSPPWRALAGAAPSLAAVATAASATGAPPAPGGTGAPAAVDAQARPVVGAASASPAGPALPASAVALAASATERSASAARSETMHALHEGAEPRERLAARPPPEAPEPVLQTGRRLTVVAPLDEATKAAAREAVAAARAQRQSSGSAAPASTPVWAVSTRALRTRFESEQMLLALRDASRRSGAEGATGLRFEVLPVGADWRAVSWPFAEREAAERLRAELQARGVRVEVVAF